MKVPIRWLSEYVALEAPIEDIAHRLTMAGLEVTAIERTGESWEKVVVGKVLEVEPHPDAHRLRLVTVDDGGERHKVVCGAPNVAAGQKIAYASLGARLIDAHSGEPKKLKRAKIRGVVSEGMVCSERELGLSDEHEGILVLSPEAEVGKALAEVLGETVLEIDMKPNRADGLSVLGVARDVAALTGQRLVEPSLDFEATGEPIEGRADATIDDPWLCRRFTLALIEDVTLGPSPSWMQERLLAAGMRPISNVVDISNYVMLELGQPIHAFDYDTLAEHRIVVRAAKEGEKLTTLDNKERSFTPGELLITDPRGPVAVAGVMGGLETEVTDTTKNVLLEVANFDPVSIRRTAHALNLPSEASRRFAWGLAPEQAPIASRRATKFLVELAGGRAATGMVDAYPSPSDSVRVDLPRRRIVQVLGIDPPEEEVSGSLGALGFEVETRREGFSVGVPYWRRDVRIADDLVEEVARIIGYETIPAEPLAGSIPPEVPQPLRELRSRTADILVGAGMQETINYPLTSAERLALVVAPEVLARQAPLTVINPLNAGQECLRTSLRASLLECAAHNLKVTSEELALFETARIYLPRSGSEGKESRLPEEREQVTGLVTGRRRDRWGGPTSEKVDFYDAKAYVERLFDKLGIAPDYEPGEEYGFLPGRTALVLLAGERLGVLGQVHPETASALGVDREVFIFDLSLDELARHVAPLPSYKPFARFPAVEEDLAVVVDRSTASSQVMKEILGHPLVASARIFDQYEGEQVPEGKKSIAVSVSYQAPDRTLTDSEVSKAREKIVSRLRAKCGAELRS